MKTTRRVLNRWRDVIKACRELDPRPIDEQEVKVPLEHFEELIKLASLGLWAKESGAFKALPGGEP
jgi:hypothetical protein